MSGFQPEYFHSTNSANTQFSQFRHIQTSYIHTAEKQTRQNQSCGQVVTGNARYDRYLCQYVSVWDDNPIESPLKKQVNRGPFGDARVTGRREGGLMNIPNVWYKMVKVYLHYLSLLHIMCIMYMLFSFGSFLWMLVPISYMEHTLVDTAHFATQKKGNKQWSARSYWSFLAGKVILKNYFLRLHGNIWKG